MKVLLEDKNQTVDIPDGLSPEAMETELRKFYSPEELHGSTTFMEREGYRVRKGRALVDDGKNWYDAAIGKTTLEKASIRSEELNAEFTKDNDEKHQAYNWPERFAGATTELAPYMLDSAIQGAIYGEAAGAVGASAAMIAGQMGPQALLPEEILTVPGAYIGSKAVGQAWATWMNAAQVEGGGVFKSLIEDGIDPQTARSFAIPAGYLIGAIELLQVERLLPGFGREGITTLLKGAMKKAGSKTASTLAKFSGKLAKSMAVNTTVETGQEVTQEVIGIVAEVGAAMYEDMASDEGYTGPEASEIQDRLKETLTASLLGFPLLGLPRAIHSAASLHSKDKFAERPITKKAQKALTLELTEQIENAAGFDEFEDFHNSLGEEIDDKFANKHGFDNRVLMEEAIWNESRNLQGEHIYDQNIKEREKSGGSIEEAAEGFQNVKDSISRIAEPISTTLKQINPELKNKLRRYEFNLKQTVLRDEQAVKPFLEAYKGLEERDKADLDLALKNGDMKKVEQIVSENGIENEYNSVKGMLNKAYERAEGVGLKMGFIEDYFPRQVKDVDAMLKFFKKQETWPQMQKAIKEREEKLGRKLDDEEKADLLNTMLKGFKGQSKPGNVKERAVSVVTPQINQFYHEAPQALLNYVYKVNDYIEARRFFGKSAQGSEMNEKTLEDSIGNFVLDLLQGGDISGADAQKVSDVLQARFSQKGTGRMTSAIKNITYLETMGSVTSAITQIGDIAFSLYKSGFYRTGKAVAQVLSRTAEITKEDIGIERIAEEFADKTKTAKALSKVFKLVGLEWMDRLGKEVYINAALEKFKKQANSDTKTFKKKMDDIFGEEAEQVIRDLKEGKTSDNVKFLLFSELADVQPIALSEMPEQYLTSGNGRIFYMLKTYTIKQIDVFRNEVFIDMEKRPAEAIGNLIRLSALLILANATADLLKDLLLGRENEPEDYLIDNIIRLFGISKYSLYKFKKEGVTEGVTSFVVPPLGKFITSASRDIQDILDDEFEPSEAEVIQSIPLLGKLYYWWFGGGRAKIEAEE